MTYHLKTALLALATTLPTHAIAQSSPNQDHDGVVIYGGIGGASGNDDLESDATPWSIGVYFRRKSRVIFGADFAMEGTSYDWTSRRGGAISQGHSFNALIGYSVVQAENFILDTSIMLGARETRQTCPSGQSVVGYQCWADRPPASDYEFNYGILVTAVYKSKFTFGARSTKESVQGIVGVNF